MKMKNHKWSVKDVITTVLLSVLLIVIQLVINMICMVNDFVSMVLSVGFTMLLCAPIYFLMVSRIRKRFVSLVYMTILGTVFLVMGNWYLLLYYMVVGVLCEAILWNVGWASTKKLTASWTLSSLLYNGVNILPLWFFWDTYEAFALASGMEQSYIDSFVRYYSSPQWLVFILLFTTVCGFIGSLIGGKLIQKHFKKAGVL
nr:MptD family putative ECF transporter S component [Intestinimonas massiliensis (ex Afouda et al. 2020)]